jgi:hypothetical protein
MLVKAIWEFDVDTEDLNPEFIDIPLLAKELTQRELDYLIKHNQLDAEDFEYIVEES